MFGNDLQKIEHCISKNNAAKLASFLRSKDKGVRLAAIKGLGQVQGEEAFNELTTMLSSTDAQERAAAAEALGELGMERAGTFIAHCVTTETDPAAKEAMGKAMAALHKHGL